MAPAYVYMVRCQGSQLYTGWTTDPAARLHAHKTGKGARATRAFHAIGMAYLERCGSKSEALRREAALKKLPKAEGEEALCAAWAENSCPRLSIATRADAAEILAIYNWYVMNRIATFQITPSTLEEYEQWVEDTLARAPLILARDGSGRLLGYACAHRYHAREAFDWDVESTIYCAPDACSAGVGPALYGALLELLKYQATGTSMPCWPIPTPPASGSMKIRLCLRRGAAPTPATSSAGGRGCPPGGCPCARAMQPPSRYSCSWTRPGGPGAGRYSQPINQMNVFRAPGSRAPFLLPGKAGKKAFGYANQK